MARRSACGAHAAYGAALVKRAQVGDRADSPHPHRRGCRAHLEAGDRARHGRVHEGERAGVEHVQRLPAEAVEEQLAHQFPVVHVQPL